MGFKKVRETEEGCEELIEVCPLGKKYCEGCTWKCEFKMGDAMPGMTPNQKFINCEWSHQNVRRKVAKSL
jgi:hypothetical protein